MLKRTIFGIPIFLVLSFSTLAQKSSIQNSPKLRSAAEMGMDTSANVLTLIECLKYAFKNQPAINQSFIDEAIARTNNSIAFSGWLPQVTGAANYQNYFQLPTTFATING